MCCKPVTYIVTFEVLLCIEFTIVSAYVVLFVDAYFETYTYISSVGLSVCGNFAVLRAAFTYIRCTADVGDLRPAAERRREFPP